MEDKKYLNIFKYLKKESSKMIKSWENYFFYEKIEWVEEWKIEIWNKLWQFSAENHGRKEKIENCRMRNK